MLDPGKILHGQIWRLVTYDFLHSTGGIWHLFWNMYLLYMAGSRVESTYGPREFLWFYLISAVFAGAFFLLWGLLMGTAHAAIGASGAVMAVLIVYAMHWPMDRWFILIFPVPVVLIVILDAALDLFPLLSELGGRPVGDNVAHAAHIGGMLFGFLYVRQQWRVSTWIPSHVPHWKTFFKRRPKLRVHVPEREEPRGARPIPPNVESRLDELLEKISLHGERSLTEDERRFLSEASRRYRDRH
jgi:membrane associated rhomboid family serine protease